MSKNKFICMDNVRTGAQRKVMEVIEKEGICPFCIENLTRFHDKPIIKKGKFWTLSANAHPYANTKTHMILFANKHAEKLSDLPAEAGKELFEICAFVEKNFRVKGGAIALRFGDPKYSAATIKHLHWQFVEPDVAKLGPDESVAIYIGKPLKKKGVKDETR